MAVPKPQKLGVEIAWYPGLFLLVIICCSSHAFNYHNERAWVPG